MVFHAIRMCIPFIMDLLVLSFTEIALFAAWNGYRND